MHDSAGEPRSTVAHSIDRIALLRVRGARVRLFTLRDAALLSMRDAAYPGGWVPWRSGVQCSARFQKKPKKKKIPVSSKKIDMSIGRVAESMTV